MTALSLTRVALATSVAMLLLATSASFVDAQEESELYVTIRAAIQADARSQGMSEAEIDAMTKALVAQAMQENISASDVENAAIASNTATDTAGAPSAACGSLICKINEAFGITGESTLIPITLGVTSAVLLFVTGMLIEHHRRKLASTKA